MELFLSIATLDNKVRTDSTHGMEFRILWSGNRMEFIVEREVSMPQEPHDFGDNAWGVSNVNFGAFDPAQDDVAVLNVSKNEVSLADTTEDGCELSALKKGSHIVSLLNIFVSSAYAQERQFPDFQDLWKNYPEGSNGSNAMPSNDSYARNQCAIRMGVTLDGAGIDISGYPQVNKTSEGWPRSSKGLADWLWQELERPLIMSQEEFEKQYRDATGIIYLKPEEGGIGHIDLCNGGDTGSGYYDATEVWFWPID